MDAALLEAIAETVHDGWAAEKVKQGFADHVYKTDCTDGLHTNCPCSVRGCETPQAKHHGDMLPYADLAEHVKEYDRATVRAVFAGIAAAGYQVVQARPERLEARANDRAATRA